MTSRIDILRVNELPELTDVWLSNAASTGWSGWDPSGVDTSTPVVQFTTSAPPGAEPMA